MNGLIITDLHIHILTPDHSSHIEAFATITFNDAIEIREIALCKDGRIDNSHYRQFFTKNAEAQNEITKACFNKLAGMKNEIARNAQNIIINQQRS